MHMTRKLLACALGHALCAPAIGQAGDASADDAALLDQVVVVGSRIRRVDVETSQPVFVLEQEQIQRTGLVSLGDILQDLTAHGAALNTTVNNGGNGDTLIDLRNLGPNRTLVLVNGRRWNTGLDGVVDLNEIPLAIVERIEVLKDGASAIYGSDAIAGVINITTRADYEGLEARAYIGENEEGDGRVESYDATMGASSERGNVVFNVSYVKQEPIFAGEREISAVPVFGLPPNDLRAFASPSTPLGRYGFGPAGNCPFNPAGTYPGGPGCNGRQGRPPGARNRFDPASGGYPLFDPFTDAYNFAPENYLQTPQERTSLYVQTRYDLSPTVALTTEVLYNERRSAQLLAPSPFNISVAFGPPFNFAIPADHVYNPFGQPVTSLSLRPGGQSRRFEQDSDTFRAGGGLGGQFELFERSFAWDFSAVHAQQELNQSDSGQLNGFRMIQALGPSYRDAGGVARCGTPLSPIAGCVPLDAFRGPEAFTPEMLEFLYFTAQSRYGAELWNYSANLTGDLVDLPAGPLAFAAGYEYRRDRGEYEPDALLQLGSLGGFTPQPEAGTSSVDEFYAEFVVPLLAERPFAEVLEVNMAARWSDYDSFGDTTNLKAGFRWKPIGELLVRGNYSEGFRAPTLDELFAPATSTFGLTVEDDPCVIGNSPTDPANCAADGVPGGAYEPVANLYDIVFGGNTELLPETAVTKTLGLVWSPPWIEGFDLALDWYRIEIADAIAPTDPFTLIQICVFQAVPEACARTTRDSTTGELVFVDSRALNSGNLDVEGYDLTIRYARQTSIGRFSMLWDSTYYAEYTYEIPRGAMPVPVPGNYTTFEPGWRYRSNLDLAWQRGDWEASFGVRYYPGLDEGCFLNAFYFDACSSPDVESPVFFGFPENRIDDRWYFDLQGAWNTPWSSEIRVGIQNLFDEDPPVSYSAFANSFDPQYPVPGRFWYASYTQKF
jgi:iron complex outermembrane receptor protein